MTELLDEFTELLESIEKRISSKPIKDKEEEKCLNFLRSKIEEGKKYRLIIPWRSK